MPIPICCIGRFITHVGFSLSSTHLIKASWANRSGDNRIGGAASSGFYLTVKRRRSSSAGKVRGYPDRILAPHPPSRPPLTLCWLSLNRILASPFPSRPDLGCLSHQVDECWWWCRLAVLVAACVGGWCQ
jgi:hypothetical protein